MPFRFNFKGGGGVSLKTEGSWGSQGSCHSDSASRVGVGVSLKTEGSWGSQGSFDIAQCTEPLI